MVGTVNEGFSGRKAAEIVGISYRQLDYWARTDLVRPSLAEATGSGSRRSYAYLDLLELKVIKTLLDAGIKLESVRQVFSFLREQLGQDITAANLVISGQTVMLKSGEELIDVLAKGQGVFNILPLAGVRDEIDARVRGAAPGTGRAWYRRPAAAPVDPICRRRLSQRCATPPSTQSTDPSAPRWSPSGAGRCRCPTRRGRWRSTAPVVAMRSPSMSVISARSGCWVPAPTRRCSGR